MVLQKVWTFVTPFIGGVCNCDRSDCMAMKATIALNFPVMFRAEYVAQVNPDSCNGCRQCMRVCQFGAMGYSLAHNKIIIDPKRCFGCGICRAGCTKDAIALTDRSAVAVAARLWWFSDTAEISSLFTIKPYVAVIIHRVEGVDIDWIIGIRPLAKFINLTSYLQWVIAGAPEYAIYSQTGVRKLSTMPLHSKPEAKNSTHSGRIPNFLVYRLLARTVN